MRPQRLRQKAFIRLFQRSGLHWVKLQRVGGGHHHHRRRDQWTTAWWLYHHHNQWMSIAWLFLKSMNLQLQLALKTVGKSQWSERLILRRKASRQGCRYCCRWPWRKSSSGRTSLSSMDVLEDKLISVCSTWEHRFIINRPPSSPRGLGHEHRHWLAALGRGYESRLASPSPVTQSYQVSVR